MAQSKSLSSYLECSICMETFRNPKSLPCDHMFCLKCLEIQGKQDEKLPGDDMLCPLCRHPYIIPANGFEGLRKNFVIQDMLNDLASDDKAAKRNETKCDACKTSAAWGYCAECEQNLCQPCKVSHGNLRLTAAHRVLSMEEKDSSGLVFAHHKSRYCDEHKDEQMKLYCRDCKEPICPMCWPLKHQQHGCEDLKDAARKFTERIKSGYPRLAKGVEASRNAVKKLEAEKQAFLEEVKAKEREIVKKRDELMHLVETQGKQLLQQLEEFKTKRVKEINTRKYEIEAQVATVESFQHYIGQLTEKGTPCDVSRRAADLLAQTETLVKKMEDAKSAEVGLARMTFTAAGLTASMRDETGLIGQLSLLTGTLKGWV